MKAFALNRYSKSNGVDEVDVAVPQLREGDVLTRPNCQISLYSNLFHPQEECHDSSC
jgi:hypothetical protein